MERNFKNEITALSQTIDEQEMQSVGGKTQLERENAKAAGQNVTKLFQHVLDDFNKLPKDERQMILGQLDKTALKHLKFDRKGEDDLTVTALHIPPLFDAPGKKR